VLDDEVGGDTALGDVDELLVALPEGLLAELVDHD
jgi:predicted RNA-binding protein associated with RNAse of E/G family